MSEQATSHTYIEKVLTTSTRTVYSEEYYAATADGQGQSGSRNVTMTRTAVGQWDVVMTPAHPDGIDYHVSFEAEEQNTNRDAPDLTIVQGSKTASTFMVQITTGDNGGTADVYIDTPFTLAIDAPVEVMTSATLGASNLTPASGVLVADNFQDGNGGAPFNLQVRNDTGSATTWTAVIRDVPYASITNLSSGSYALTTTGAGPYTHTFTGTSPLGAYSNVTITGDAPSPAGVGTANGSPELYL